MEPAATTQELEAVQAFLHTQGIGMEVFDENIEGFLPGLCIVDGGLRVGRGASLDSILHEAGHLATTPAPFRAWMSGNLAHGQRRMAAALSVADLDPESDLVRHSIQCSDPEATAWAFAAGRHLGLQDERIILDSSYDGEGATIRMGLAAGHYPGINGLAAAGMCHHGFGARMRGQETYPVMQRWVQDGPYPEYTPPACKLRGPR